MAKESNMVNEHNRVIDCDWFSESRKTSLENLGLVKSDEAKYGNLYKTEDGHRVTVTLDHNGPYFVFWFGECLKAADSNFRQFVRRCAIVLDEYYDRQIPKKVFILDRAQVQTFIEEICEEEMIFKHVVGVHKYLADMCEYKSTAGHKRFLTRVAEEFHTGTIEEIKSTFVGAPLKHIIYNTAVKCLQ